MQQASSSHYICTLWVVASLLVVSGGCSNKKEISQPSSMSSMEISNDVPEDFKIMWGYEGGGAGQIMGHTIDAEGNVHQWSGKYPEERIDRTSTISMAEVEKTWAHVLEANYFNIDQFDQSGNALFLNVYANGMSHRVSWASLGQAEGEGAAWHKLYEMCEATLQHAFATQP